MDEKDYLMRQIKNFGKGLRQILSDESADEILNFGEKEEQMVKFPEEKGNVKPEEVIVKEK